MDKVLNPSDSECYMILSESFRLYTKFVVLQLVVYILTNELQRIETEVEGR
jgi:hypothetical protein